MTEEKKEEKKPAESPSDNQAGKDEKGKESVSAEASADKEVEVPKKFKSLVEEIEKMSVLDLAELVKILEKKFGVSAAAPVVAVSAPLSEGGAEAGEEKSEFNIILSGVGEKKIEVIKAVRDVTEKGLKEAKDLVDAAANEPQTVRENVKKEEADEIKKKFDAAGAKVELK